MMGLSDTLKAAVRDLTAHSESPRLDAEVLLARILGCSRSELHTRLDSSLTPAQTTSFEEWIAQRRHGKPVAYLTGTREFWSLELSVTPSVLVPRPDTEILIERALDVLPRERELSVLDLGTGSGAIALAIARERPMARITGTDISTDALAVARANAAKHDAQGIHWRQGSWFAAVPGQRFDLVLCNPPYIAAADPRLKTLRFEPRAALTPGPSGLEAYAHIIPQSRAYLTSSGWIMFEHGANQAADVANLLVKNGFFNVRSHPDYAGMTRVTVGSIVSVN